MWTKLNQSDELMMPPDHCRQQTRLWSLAELPCLLYLHLSLILTIQTNYVTLAFTTLADIVTALWLRYQPHLITSTGVLLELQTLLQYCCICYTWFSVSAVWGHDVT